MDTIQLPFYFILSVFFHLLYSEHVTLTALDQLPLLMILILWFTEYLNLQAFVWTSVGTHKDIIYPARSLFYSTSRFYLLHFACFVLSMLIWKLLDQLCLLMIRNFWSTLSSSAAGTSILTRLQTYPARSLFQSIRSFCFLPYECLACE